MYPCGFFYDCARNGNDLAAIFANRDLSESAKTAYGLNGTVVRYVDGREGLGATLAGLLWHLFSSVFFPQNGSVVHEVTNPVAGALNVNWNTELGPVSWIGRREIVRFTPDTQVANPFFIEDHFFDVYNSPIERELQVVPGEACEGRAVLLNFVTALSNSCKQSPSWLNVAQVGISNPTVAALVHNTDYTGDGTVITAPYTKDSEEVREITRNRDEILTEQLAPRILSKIRDSLLYSQEKAANGHLLSPQDASKLPEVKDYGFYSKQGNGKRQITVTK